MLNIQAFAGLWAGFFLCRFDTDSSGGNTTQSTTTQNLDKRLVVDGNGVGVSSDESTVNVSSLDGGAIAAALGLAGESVKSAGDSFSDLLNFAGDTSASSESRFTQAVDFAGNSLDTAAGILMQTLKSQAETERATLDFASKANAGAMQFAFDAGAPDASLMQNYGKYLSIAGGLVGLALIWARSK